MREKLRKTAIGIIGDVPWGTHFCQFYQSKEDLIEILVPYFKQGLENNEFCMWVTAEPLGVEDAKTALKEKVKNLDDYIRKGQIEILDYNQWYTTTGGFEADKVLEGWVEKEKQAIEKGFDGLRLTSNTFWLKKKDWQSFADYEAVVNSVIGKHRMLAICSYSLDRCQAGEVIDVVNNHQFALIRKEGKWTTLESSKRKQMEEKLRASEHKYRTLVENLPQKIFLKDANSVYISCNEAYARDLKIGPEEIAGKTDYDFYPKKLAEKYRGDDKRIIESAETKDIEEEYLQDGQKRVVHTVKTPVKDEKGSVVGVLGIFWDITKFKQAEEEMESLNRKLQATVEELTQSNNELQEFVHVASHDLKTPLRAIGILADWILTDYGDKFDESGRERVKMLVGRAKRIDELISGLLQYFQVGHTRGKYEEVDLNIVLSEVIREIAPPENIEITIQSELPTVIGEQRRMVQIFQNLLNNAIKYIEKPRGEIEVGCVEEDGFWKFSVCDNGSGIEQKYFGKLFKVFQKLESHDESEGTGIGLAIVKKIVELYGGRVWIESRLREGSTFFFTLPKKEMGVKNAKLKADIACGR